MKKRELIIKFTYNGIQIIKDNKIYYYELKSSVENHRVINSEIFTQDFSNIIEELKINNNLLSDNIKIIIDSTYNYEDKKLITSLFKELSFNKIIYFNIIDLFSINSNELTIELNKNDFKIYYLNNTYKGDIYFNKPVPIVDTYLKPITSNHQINTIYIFGESEKIYKMLNFIEKKYHISTYYYSHPKLYPLTELVV